MDQDKLFNILTKNLLEFTKHSVINTEIMAEQYRRKFTTLFIDKKYIHLKDKDIYNSLFDVMYIDNQSDKLSTSRYVKLALNFILGKLTDYLGISFKEFLKLTLEETDLLLDIVSLKQNIESETQSGLKDDLSKDLDISSFTIKGD